MMDNGITGKLKFQVDRTTYTLSFERYYLSDQIEKVKVFGKEREIHFRTDRPEIRNNNRKRAAKFKIIEGASIELVKYPAFINALIFQLETMLDHIDFPQPPQTHRKNIF